MSIEQSTFDTPFSPSLLNPETEPTSVQAAFVSVNEKINDTDFMSQQSPHIIFEVFSYLSFTELAKCCLVSRRWRRLASDASLWNALDLRKIFPSLKVFDESDWATQFDLPSLGLDVIDAPALDKRQAIPVLKRLSSLPIEGDAGITLLTLPRGLTINKLADLANAPQVGEGMKFRLIWGPFQRAHGDDALGSIKRIAITNNVLEDTRGKSFADQKALLEGLKCRLPRTLEVSTLCITSFNARQITLYNDDPWTYTRCEEEIRGKQIVVGGVTSTSLYVLDNSSNHDVNGAGAALELF